jgi:hypothetical protein
VSAVILYDLKAELPQAYAYGIENAQYADGVLTHVSRKTIVRLVALRLFIEFN